MPIRLLPDHIINRIAAGEVVERPAAVVKELVENAIDAGATRIDVTIRDGGRTLIAIRDDGCGMDREDLELCIERHATSKLQDDHLVRITTMGFRGEALAAIAAVARVAITTRRHDGEGWRIEAESGQPRAARPAPATPGTTIEVRDLFFATPARLKFMRSERTESAAVRETVQALMLANPRIAFSLTRDGDNVIRSPGADPGEDGVHPDRAAAVIGADFAAASVPLRLDRPGVTVRGRASLPTLVRTHARDQLLFVNGRPIRDKALSGALKGAYMGMMEHGRHPAAVVFLTVPDEQIDVNVHPAKVEVRFSAPEDVRGGLVRAVRDAIAAAGPAIAPASFAALRPTGAPARPEPALVEAAIAFQRPLPLPATTWSPAASAATPPSAAPSPGPDGAAPPSAALADAPSPPGVLGKAIGQAHGTWIIAETPEGIVIVDGHAAHERVLLEKMKATVLAGAAECQRLLMPLPVDLPETDAAALTDAAPELARYGLEIEPFGPGCVLVRSIPALLGGADPAALARGVGASLREVPAEIAVAARIEAVCATICCHRALKAGDRLSLAEMDSLLRRMEATPNAGQCNHGRRTWILVPTPDIERRFGRA